MFSWSLSGLSCPATDPTGARYYYRARYYDPKVGRFISEDPIGFKGGLNYYAYVKSRPADRVDPGGLREMEIVRCKPGVYGDYKGERPHAVLCCKDQRFAICVEEGQYPSMSLKIRECLQAHEGYHAAQRREREGNAAGCGECNEPPCTYKVTIRGADRLREECQAQLISLRCFMGTDEIWPDNHKNAMSEALSSVWICQNNGYLPK